MPSVRNETANAFDRRTCARVRLSSERANATRGGLNDVCMSHVPNIKWSEPSSVFVPTTYAPYGIICRTAFFAFLSIDPPRGPSPPRVMKHHGPGSPVDRSVTSGAEAGSPAYRI